MAKGATTAIRPGTNAEADIDVAGIGDLNEADIGDTGPFGKGLPDQAFRVEADAIEGEVILPAAAKIKFGHAPGDRPAAGAEAAGTPFIAFQKKRPIDPFGV